MRQPKQITVLDRLVNAIWGAMLGTFAALGAFLFVDGSFDMQLLTAIAGASAFLAFVVGREAIDWLRNLVRTVW